MMTDRLKRQGGSGLVDRLDAVFEHWIGFAMPHVESVLREANWKADRREDYCPRCGVTVGAGEQTQSGCGSCRDAPGLADGIVRLGSYADDLREWILALKYQSWAEMGLTLGRRLGQQVGEAGVIDKADWAVVMPMPMPWPRRLYRGIDHARVIASGVARELEAPMILFLNKRNGPPQVSLPTSQRRRSGSRGLRVRSVGRFVPHAKWLRGATILLVDDVCTTGASVRAAARLLRPFKPERICAAVLGVSDDAARRKRTGRPEMIEEAKGKG